MKVLCRHCPEIMGFATALDKLGHEAFLWQGVPAFDIFDQMEPDLFITRSMDRATIKCVNERPNMHTMIWEHANNWRINGEVSEVPDVVDNITFHHVETNPHMVSDLTYFGSPNPLLMELAYPPGKVNLKIFGTDSWPIPQYMGMVTTQEHREAYSSAGTAFVTNLTEAMRAMNCKAFCLTDRENLAEALDIPLVEHDVEDLYGMMTHALQNPDECKEWVDEHYNAMQKATYTILMKTLMETVFK